MSLEITRPRLSAKARLRFDRHGQQHMLLAPEKGLALNASAAEVVRLCDGEHEVSEIVAELQQLFRGASPERIEREVIGFLTLLSERGLLEEG